MASELRPIAIEIIGDEAAPLHETQGGELVLYLDTSALLKLYIEEAHSDVVERAVAEAIEISVSEIADLEARAALARVRHLGEITEDDLDRALHRFSLDLYTLRLVRYDEELARQAGALARKHGDPPLRAYDALHLASVLEALRPVRESAVYDCRFLAFDRRLVRAARAEGLRLYFDPFAGAERGEEGGDVLDPEESEES